MGTEERSPWGALFARGPCADLVSADGWVQAMLEVEVALARGAVRVGLGGADAAEAVARAAEQLRSFRPETMAAGNPVPELVAALRQLVPEGARGLVHLGATSQDIIDTALMLLLRRGAHHVGEALDASASFAAGLAVEHRATVMLGRTLLQPALPITFGLKAAGWLRSFAEAAMHLASAVETHGMVQFGGAVGTLASLGDKGEALAQALADELGLKLPPLPWHGFRMAPLAQGAAFAQVAAGVGKVARDFTLLAQHEVAEVSEGPGGGSSTMPHKQNPVCAISVLACTKRVPGLLSTLLASAEQEHERAAGAWHAEWETYSELLRLTGSGCAWMVEVLRKIQVHPEQMWANYERTQGLPLAEKLRARLLPVLGHSEASRVTQEAVALARAQGCALPATLEVAGLRTTLVEAGVDVQALTAELRPEQYLGATQVLIDRCLSLHGGRYRTS